MRTDAKVGLIFALALVIAVVAYFALHKDATPVKSPAEVAPLAATPPAPTPDTPPAPPAPAYASDTTPFIAPPSTGPAPSGPLVVNPPHGLLPAAPTTNPAGGGVTSTMPAPYTPPLVDNAGGPGRSSTEVPSSERPRDDSSLLEHNPPHATIGESSVGSGTYTIQAGDTLAAIAKKNGVTLKALEAANPKVDPTHLKIKQVIKLPAPSAVGSSTPATPATPASPTTRPARHHPAAAVAPASSTGSTAVAGKSYTVKKGDTLRKIAKSVYGDEAQWKVIFRANRDQLDSADDIDPGMVLKIPSK